jgi:formate dehydrogenase iron-sulfur subunit
MLMEGDPFALVEGMAIAGFAVGAQRGYIYLRSEYPDAIRKLEAAIALSAQLVAPFVVEVRVGAGAYVCGEETSLLNSLEGKRGEVRAKPPLPALEGLFGCPTVVNNVLTLAAVPHILTEGGAAIYEGLGIDRSKGTMPIQLAGNIRHGGLYETAFGVTLGELVHEIGGGTASGRPVKAVQVGGPLGAYIHPDRFDLPFDYEAFAAADGLIGHGGITVFDDTVDMGEMAHFAFEFCAAESCGKCTPCRLGAVRGVEVIERIRGARESGIARQPDRLELAPQMHNTSGQPRSQAEERELLEDLCEVMKDGSLCALGGFTPYPVLSALRNWPEDFGIRVPETADDL